MLFIIEQQQQQGARTDWSSCRLVSFIYVTCKVLESIMRDNTVDHMAIRKPYAKCENASWKHRCVITQYWKLQKILEKQFAKKPAAAVHLHYLKKKKEQKNSWTQGLISGC